MADLAAHATLTLHQVCRSCAGKGATPQAGRCHCRHCGAEYGDAELRAAGVAQPCGHSSAYRREGRSCAFCRGRGEWDVTVTVGELADWLAARQAAPRAGPVPQTKKKR